MDNLSIVGYTIGQLSNESDALARYTDPSGYLTECTPEWVNLLDSNPASQDTDQAIILTVDRDTVVGRLGMHAGSVSINQQKHTVFWIRGFFLRDGYRHSGAGGLMLLRAISHSKCLLASGAPGEDAQALYLGTGFVELGPLRRYVYWLRSEVILKKFLTIPGAPWALSLAMTPLLRAYYFVRRPGPKRALEFKSVTEFGDQVNRVLDRREGNRFFRDARTLTWVLEFQRDLSAFEVFRRGTCIGYCILRTQDQPASGHPHRLPPMRVTSLLDYYLEGPTVAQTRTLISFCLAFAKGAGADVFECQCHDDELAKVCSQFGMVHLGGNRILFRAPSGVTVSPQDSWFLTHGESDVILGDGRSPTGLRI